VLRHSRAHRCRIRVVHESGRARLELIDDGPPALRPPVTAGHGLRGLAERVAALNGELKAGAESGGGFTLSVSIPMETT